MRVRVNAMVAVQAGCAAGLSWFVAHTLLGRPVPFFAPIAAVVVLAVSSGHRLRRAIELVLGVALGIAIADAVIYVIGVGAWQITVVVTLAIAAAIFFGGQGVGVGQAASSAVLVATLAPVTSGGLFGGRFLDALIGGTVGLAVMAVVPFHPRRAVARAARPALGLLATELDEVATALGTRDAQRASGALDRLRAGQGEMRQFSEELAAARETARLAPAAWRTRPAVTRYLAAEVHIDRAYRNSRVLAARAFSLLDEGERAPDELARSVASLAGSVQALRADLAGGLEPVAGRDKALGAVRLASTAYANGLGFYGSVIVAQVRSGATDLLRAAGVGRVEAERAVRCAVAGASSGPPGRTELHRKAG
jgi:uncharacterized membrane protein YgaE (UPF0421/DUF939 family)